MLYLHSKNICHRDIKLDNIFIFRYSIVKVGDLGLARKKDLKKSNARKNPATPKMTLDSTSETPDDFMLDQSFSIDALDQINKLDQNEKDVNQRQIRRSSVSFHKSRHDLLESTVRNHRTMSFSSKQLEQ
jgi:serine/threonine protein kinase